jgi:hypothetical protein
MDGRGSREITPNYLWSLSFQDRSAICEMLIRFAAHKYRLISCGEIEAKERQMDDNSKRVSKP